MKSILLIFIIIFSTLFLSCARDENYNVASTIVGGTAYIPMRSTSHYDVINEVSEITVDGIVDESAWDNISPIEGSFHYPWQKIRSPKTIFKAFQSDGNFYFSFVSYDEDIVFSKDWDGERTVDNEDRIEIFFAQPSSIDKPGDNGMPKYYAIEVDPLARVHDYSVVYYRNLDSDWNMDGLVTKATMDDNSYTIEGMIPINTLKKLNLINSNDTMRIGLYRAEFSINDDETIDMKWISWVNPKTKNPDYHVDSSFGEFRFIE